MGFAVWFDQTEKVVWAQGTHEYRPMGAAVIALEDQFRPRDFRQSRKRPRALDKRFAGFFGSLEAVNAFLHASHKEKRSPSPTPAHLI